MKPHEILEMPTLPDAVTPVEGWVHELDLTEPWVDISDKQGVAHDHDNLGATIRVKFQSADHGRGYAWAVKRAIMEHWDDGPVFVRLNVVAKDYGLQGFMFCAYTRETM